MSLPTDSRLSSVRSGYFAEDWRSGTGVPSSSKSVTPKTAPVAECLSGTVHSWFQLHHRPHASRPSAPPIDRSDPASYPSNAPSGTLAGPSAAESRSLSSLPRSVRGRRTAGREWTGPPVSDDPPDPMDHRLQSRDDVGRISQRLRYRRNPSRGCDSVSGATRAPTGELGCSDSRTCCRKRPRFFTHVSS